MMNNKFRFLVLLILVCGLAFAVGHKPVEAGGRWVTDFGTQYPWQVTQACQNGFEILIVHNRSKTLDSPVEGITRTIQPRLLTREPSEDWFSPFHGFYIYPWDDATESLTYYPAVGASLLLSTTEVSETPIFLDIPGQDPSNYYMHIMDDLRFYENLPVGSWVLLDELNLVEVEDCLLGKISSESAALTKTVKTNYQHVPTDSLIYRVNTAPNHGELTLGGTGLSMGDYFSATNLATGGLHYSAAGSDDFAEIMAQATYRVSVDKDGLQLVGNSSEPSISAEGKELLFTTTGIINAAIDANGTSDVAKWTPEGTQIVSRLQLVATTGNGASFKPAISPDGRTAVFASNASNLVRNIGACTEKADTNGATDVFQVKNDIMSRYSLFSFPSSSGCDELPLNSFAPAVANTGQVVFHTFSRIPGSVSIDNNNSADVVGFNLGGSSLYSDIFIGDFPFTGNAGSYNPDISADGTTVVYDTDASNLFPNDTNGVTDIVLWREGEPLKVVSVSSAEQLGTGGGSFLPVVSRFGDQIAFHSTAVGLTPIDPGGMRQVYLRDEAAGCTVPVSVSQSGGLGNGASGFPSISADGRFVTFQSSATNLIENDTNGQTDVFVFDRDADLDGNFYSSAASCLAGPSRMIRASVGSDGTQANGASRSPDLSDNGEFVAFESDATNLVPNDTNSTTDVFVHYLGFTVELRFSEPPTPMHRVYLPLIRK